MARRDIGAVIGVGLLISVMLACVSPVEAARANDASSKKMDLNAMVNRALAGIESEDESAAAERSEDGPKAGAEGVPGEGAVAPGLKGA
ncbi:MAG: hypothetical protein CMJ49_02265 [Planctomycetaceae bacterium]|nr:hypothetical protein [Planctomycetaceae bacterium]